MKIPFFSFEYTTRQIKPAVLRQFEEFYDSQWYVLGKFTERFEQQYAIFNQVKHCVGVSNGLDALHLGLRALGVGPGDEVIVPSNTYIATVLAVTHVGATPVFVEPRIETGNLNPDAIERSLTSRTKAIMPVHLYGQACEMKAIMQVAQEYGLWVVEDNAQAHGAAYNGQLTGSFGHLNATSFYPTKNIGAIGEAGAVTTNDPELAEKITVLRNYGSQERYYNEVVGFNNRIDEFEAAYLTKVLDRIEEWTLLRQQIAALYEQELSSLPNIDLIKLAPGASSVYHLFVIRVKERDSLRAHLAEKGIGTQIHYPVPPHLQKAYEHLGHEKGDFPVAEELAETCLSLPIWPGLGESRLQYIVNMIKEYFDENT